jgi:hypothetical protein
MLRGVLPEQQLNTLRQAVLAQPDVPPSRTIAQLDLPPAERRPVEILQSLLEKAEKKDPQGVAAAFRTTEGEALQNRLTAIAGGETAEQALTTRKTAQEALRTATTPMREEALGAASRTGQAVAKLESIATSARKEASEAVDFVRRSDRMAESANEWAKNWAPSGGARAADVGAAPRPPGRFTFPGELAQRIPAKAEAAAEASRRAGGQARAAENTLESMRARGIEPITNDKLTGPLQQLLRDPEIATNREANAAIQRIGQMVNDWTGPNGFVDPYALYAIRKNGVQGVIRELNPGMDAASQDKMAASVLSRVTPMIDDLIEKAGGKGFREYTRAFSSGMSQIRAMELADQIRKRYSAGTATVADKQYIVDLVRGESPEVIEELFGSGKYKIGEQMAKDMPLLKELADTIGFDLKFAEQAKAGRAALAELSKEQAGWRLRFPFFTRASTAINEIASALEDKVANQTMERLIQAAQSGRNFDEIIKVLPTAERNAVLRVLRTPADWNRFSTGVATAAAGTQTVEPRNALAPESQNALAE